MSSSTRTGELPKLPEDTLDLGERVDPVRTLLRRVAGGDRGAAATLIDLLAPRVHGLALHVTGSSPQAGRLLVAVLRSCLHDAAMLAASGLPGETAVLDRARRAAVATSPSGDVRSLAALEASAERTRDQREIEVMRALLVLPPAQRAVMEAAAQGRFPYAGEQRTVWGGLIARVLDQLVPFGGPDDAELRGLAALDALALADDDERARLRALTTTGESAVVHRHAIEASARLTLLTATAPTWDPTERILTGFTPPPPSEPQYRGTYETPVLGTSTQQRQVGPPVLTGGVSAQQQPSTPSSPPAPVSTANGSGAPSVPAPAFTFHRSEEAPHVRRVHRRADPPRRAPRWFSRSLAALALAGLLVLAAATVDARRDLADEQEFTATWTRLSTVDGAELVAGTSDNGTWSAVITADGLALAAHGVEDYAGSEVLQLWAETDGQATDLGVLETDRAGRIRHLAAGSAGTAQRLVVTREMAPRNQSGTPSTRVVASFRT